MNNEAVPRVPRSVKKKKSDTNENPYKYPLTFIIFGILCFLTSYYLSGSTSDSVSKTVKPSGSVIGPLEATKSNQVFEIKFSQYVKENRWSAVNIDVLDNRKKFLYSLGKEFWHETGYDDGHWREQDTSENVKVTFKEKGRYYLKVSSEGPTVYGNKEMQNNISVTYERRRGSHLPHLIAGIISLIIGVGSYLFVSGSYRKFKTVDIISFGFLIFIFIITAAMS